MEERVASRRRDYAELFDKRKQLSAQTQHIRNSLSSRALTPRAAPELEAENSRPVQKQTEVEHMNATNNDFAPTLNERMNTTNHAVVDNEPPLNSSIFSPLNLDATFSLKKRKHA